MKSWHKFKDYTLKEIIKINIISTSIYIVILLATVMLGAIILDGENSREVTSNITFLALIIFFSGLILIIYTTLLPLFLSVSCKWLKNIVNYIGVDICSLGVTILIGLSFNNIKLALIYLALFYGGIAISISGKYTSIKIYKEKNLWLIE